MSVQEAQERQQRFETLLTEEAYQAAWRYCCSLTATQADAEDLLHDSLFRALRSVEQVREAAAFRSWLLCIVRRQFLNGLRGKRQDAQGRQRLAEVRAGELASPEIHAAVAALADLPQDQRSLLTLFYIEGFSMQELGRWLGIRPLAVQGRLARARDALRRVVERTASSAANAERSYDHGH